MQYSTVIKKSRKKAGLSQMKLAKKAGISKTYLQKIEGGRVPGPDARAKLAAALSLSPETAVVPARSPRRKTRTRSKASVPSKAPEPASRVRVIGGRRRTVPA